LAARNGGAARGKGVVIVRPLEQERNIASLEVAGLI
jgi:hypothetical protein